MSFRDTFSRNEIIGFAAACAIIALLCGAYACLSHVGPGESVVMRCGQEVTVWRAPEDAGLHWDGLCGTDTYEDEVGGRFSIRVAFDDGVSATVRGSYLVRFPQDRATVIEMSSPLYAFSQEALLENNVVPKIEKAIRAAAADPAWRQPQGNLVKRELKGAVEYGLRRFSPTGGIWSAPENRHALQAAIQTRLDSEGYPPGISVKVQLGFVTER